MKKLILTALIALTTVAIHAQVYGGGNTKVGNGTPTTKKGDSNIANIYSTSTNMSDASQQPTGTAGWNSATSYGIGYAALFDYADKGSLGLQLHGGLGSGVGMSMIWDGIYSLSTKKFMKEYAFHVGPNFNTALGDNAILYAPLCLSVTGEGDSKPTWGASFIPSLGVKFDRLFISAGWCVTYGFKASKFNAKSFVIHIGVLEL